ncbi:AsnC family transcriptional regulator [Actinoplanes sp. NBRC 101535]|uniref:Lrp/AsnC family transcriptional regulator n=1 Tax=Actinoplanes sp. NBRC 101535 TaxID=3032196 RepID=UPI0024A524F6|nr:AsnC family transcriptional regulator [Actinoplanes sp. NBRC 101535]GLY06626.1 hypothetical protein Acsp01_70050 [Actinoplanes sp. NBRC 101535]
MQDALDSRLTELLVRDGRATYRDLARRLGEPESTVRSRVSALLCNGDLTPTVMVHPALEQPRFLYMVRVGGADREQVLTSEAVAASPWIGLMADSGDLLIQMAAADHPEFVAGSVALRSLPGVRRAEVSVIVSVRVGAAWRGGATAWADEAVDADDVDRRLIEELRRNGRASYTALAEVSGLTVAATRRRALRLLETGAIRATVRVRASQETAEANLSMSVRAGDVPSLLADLGEHPAIRFVVEQTGPHNVAAYLITASRSELDRVAQALLDDPRITDGNAETVQILRDDLSWAAQEHRP